MYKRQLQQVAPTLNEMRVLMRDLRDIADRLDRNPAGYILGRDPNPKEFTPE